MRPNEMEPGEDELKAMSAPTPGLLTDEEKDKLAKDYPLLDFSFEDDYREEVKIMLQAQLSKLQQARPTTERIGIENIAKALFDMVKLKLPEDVFWADKWEDLNEEGKHEWINDADQILRLLPFPDEQGIRWVDRPDKSGQWWVSPLVLNDAQTEYRYISPRIMRVIDYQRPERGLEVDYDRDSIPVDKFLEEYYPDSRWLFIPEPSIAFLKSGEPPQEDQ